MKLIAANSVNLGREEHRLAPCGLRGDEIEIPCRSSNFSKLEEKGEMQLTDTRSTTAALQVVYLHQRDKGMIARYRTWTEWLSECRTRAVEIDLIAMGEDESGQLIARALASEWQVLIYEPPGLPRHASAEVQP